jgi:hypothetical protein
MTATKRAGTCDADPLLKTSSNSFSDSTRKIATQDLGPILAELIGMHQAIAAGVTVSGRNSPITALCRALLEAGHDPDSPLEAYRGTTLCLRVRSIGEGARLTIYDNSVGRPVFGPYKAWPESSAVASPVRQTAEARP